MTKTLLTCPNMIATLESCRDDLDAAGIDIIMPELEQQLSEDALIELLPGVEGVIAGDDPFTRSVLEAGEQLRVISKWGIGVDNIDLSAAAELGVIVTNTPGAFDHEVADICVGYMIMLAREVHLIDRGVRAGGWPKPIGRSLAGRTLGIVGLGGIGAQVARRALVMGMEVVAHDADPSRRLVAEDIGVRMVDLSPVFERADVLSLNCPLTPATRHLIDRAAFEVMQPGVHLINTARGHLVNEEHLIEALATGHVGAAALDVFEREPLPPESPLRRFENVILGSHNASNTRDAVERVNQRAIQNLLEGLGCA